MKKTIMLSLFAVVFMLTGCNSSWKKAAESASGKNIGLDGYVMYGSIETADSETGTPTGKLIIGRLTYKSRKVGIPADHKVPNTGSFKSTRTKSLFGTEEHIIEYDFTAGSDAEAESARNALEEKRKEAMSASTKTDNTTNPQK